MMWQMATGMQIWRQPSGSSNVISKVIFSHLFLFGVPFIGNLSTMSAIYEHDQLEGE